MRILGVRPAFRIALLLAAGSGAIFYALLFREVLSGRCIFSTRELDQEYVAREWKLAQESLEQLDPPVAGDIYSVHPEDLRILLEYCPFTCGERLARGCFIPPRYIRVVPASGVLKHEAQHAILWQVGDHRSPIIGHRSETTLTSTQSTYNSHIRWLLAIGKHDEAFAAAQAALQPNPENPHTLDNLGRVQVLRGDLQDAEASFRKAIELMPENGDFHNHLGVVPQLLGREKQAEFEFAQGTRLSPETNLPSGSHGNRE